MIVKKKLFKAIDKKTNKVVFDRFTIVGEVNAFDLISQYKLENLNDIIVLEYLNDKICEGDILKLGQRYKTESFGIGVVEWDEHTLEWLCKQMPTYATINTILCMNGAEVIGNVYENEKTYFKLKDELEKRKTVELITYNIAYNDVKINKLIAEMSNDNN